MPKIRCVARYCLGSAALAAMLWLLTALPGLLSDTASTIPAASVQEARR